MRHLKAGRKLNRNSGHRKALFRNLVVSLLRYERIETTVAKAKELRKVAERTITVAKRGAPGAHKKVFKTVKDKTVIKKLFNNLAGRFAERNGGYTRIIRIGNRAGDCASMAVIELVDREIMTEGKKKDKKKKKTEGS